MAIFNSYVSLPEGKTTNQRKDSAADPRQNDEKNTFECLETPIDVGTRLKKITCSGLGSLHLITDVGIVFRLSLCLVSIICTKLQHHLDPFGGCPIGCPMFGQIRIIVWGYSNEISMNFSFHQCAPLHHGTAKILMKYPSYSHS